MRFINAAQLPGDSTSEAGENGGHGPREDPEVQPKRPLVDVAEVELRAIVEVLDRIGPRPATGRSFPGRTDRRRRCQMSYASTSRGGAGRGPTRLMSPLSTLNSCGSSSRSSAGGTRRSA